MCVVLLTGKGQVRRSWEKENKRGEDGGCGGIVRAPGIHLDTLYLVTRDTHPQPILTRPVPSGHPPPGSSPFSGRATSPLVCLQREANLPPGPLPPPPQSAATVIRRQRFHWLSLFTAKRNKADDCF